MLAQAPSAWGQAVDAGKPAAAAGSQEPGAKRPVQTKQPPPAVPPDSVPLGEWNISLGGCPAGASADVCSQETGGGVSKLHAHPAEIVDRRMLFRAEHIEYDENTEQVHAWGNVYYHNFEDREEIWCDEVDYHTERGNEHGKYTNVVGETQPRLITKPGILTVNQPFHFEGEWAERIGAKYILYNGWVTNCTMPYPWWRLTGPKFDIVPHVRAKAYGATFRLKGLPVFYFPYFYHPLNREPRKSGFLIPEPGNSSIRGFKMGLGYFWAINRSYDVIYQAQAFSSGSLANNIDFQGKPKEGTDFDIDVFQARDSGNFITRVSGANVNGIGRANLGGGWTAHGIVNYTTSFRFRGGWAQSFGEAIGSEFHTSGYIDKSWLTFTLDVELSRLVNFQTAELPFTDPVTGQVTRFQTNAVTIRKLPEVELGSRDHSIWHGLPVWYTLDSSAGLLFRSEPFYDSNNNLTDRFETSPFTDRFRFAPHITTAIHLRQLSPGAEYGDR